MKQEILEKGRRHSLRPTVMTQATVNGVIIENNNVRTRYLHMENTPQVHVGEVISTKRTQLGVIGSTGRSESPHLHYEIQHKVNGEWIKINPFVRDPKTISNFSDTVQLKNPMLFQ